MSESMTTALPKSRSLWARLPRRILEIAGATMIAGMAVLTIADVAMRTLFNAPIRAAYDINVYWFMVGVAALGLWYAEVKREHITVTLISERATGRASLVLDILISLTSIALAVLIAWFGWQQAVFMLQQQEYVGVERVPVWPVRFIVVIGAVAYAIALALRLWRRLTGREETGVESHEDELA